MNPLSVTGSGIVSPLGIGAKVFAESVRAIPADQRRPRPTAVTTFDAASYPNAQLVEVPDFDPTRYLGDKGLRTLDRLTKLIVVAARLATHDAGLKKDGAFVAYSAERVGLVSANAYGSLEAIVELDRVATLEDRRYINPAKFPNTVSNSAAGYASIWEDLRALNVLLSDGNCGALDTVLGASLMLDTARADAVLIGGSEAMSEALYLAFHKLGALGEECLGEGAALLVVERPSDAKARGARVRGELCGFGTAFNAPPREALLHASSSALVTAMRQALDDAGLRPGDIDVVASGISGLAAFDDAEIAAIRELFGANVCVAAPKLALGETLGASAALAMTMALEWFDGAPVAPLHSGGHPVKVRNVLVIALGYYGNASAVVMRSPVPAS